MSRKPLPSVERLRYLLDYDPISGVITWRVDRPCGNGAVKMKAGMDAGCIGNRGSRVVRVDGRMYASHRIAWKLYYGEEPPFEIDHIDRNPSNNAIANLRAVKHQQNCTNKSIRNDNTSGLTGVSWSSSRKKWCAQIMVNGRAINLGRFASREEAVAARVVAASHLFGEYSPH